MASSKKYLDYILEQLSGLEGISFRPMMGEYILYYQGKVIGGVYDDRFLLKPTRAALSRMPGASLEAPSEGAKEMLLADEVDNALLLRETIEAMAGELPAPKKTGTARVRRTGTG